MEDGDLSNDNGEDKKIRESEDETENEHKHSHNIIASEKIAS